MKYYFWILGCAMNYSDAERIASVLDSLGYVKTDREAEADLFIVVSCSVRQSAINRIYGKVKDLNERKLQNPNFRTMLTGCVLETDRKKLEKVFDVIIKIDEIEKLPELLSDNIPPTVIPGHKPGISSSQDSRSLSLTTNRVGDLRGNDGILSGEYLSIIPHYESSFRAFVPISTGCNNFCSYCAVPYTRGREKSRPAEEIITEVRDLIENGYKEITLLGQNVNSYGKDLSRSLSSLVASQGPSSENLDSWPSTRNDNSLFANLLKKLDTVPGDHRIYFYSNHPKDMSDELINVLAILKHFPHYIHLPLQSGNDEILRAMNRHYTKEQYLELVKKIRKAIPDITLTTDIIVGYPGETESQFNDTADVMRIANFDMAFIAQYSPRPGTVSAKLTDNISEEEKKGREDILQKILAETVLVNNQKLVGTTQRVLIDEQKKNKLYGRTEGYKVVEIVTNPHSPYSSSVSEKSEPHSSQQASNNNKTDPIGQFVDVKIDSATSWKLFGSL